MISKNDIQQAFMSIQSDICFALEKADGKSLFSKDSWNHKEQGGGVSRVIQQGNIIEKGGVNFSAVGGILPSNIVQALQVQSNEFFATGVSIVIHPHNPFVPIIHMNIRYFELQDGTYWFGGGIDLTPHYIDKEQATFFHTQLKNVCDMYDASFYPRYKVWADDYFFIKHRNETRGIGGIFFDRLTHQNTNLSKEKLFNFVLDVGNTFAPTYTHLMEMNKNLPFTEGHKKWQYIRRGRYVEFNLVYDKGTKFGLDTGGRIESILMSLPSVAHWEYNYQPAENSKEENTLKLLRKGVDWVK